MKSTHHSTNQFRFGLAPSIIAALLAMPVLHNAHAAGIAAPSCVMNPVVTNTNDFGPGSLRDAIESACDGSTITFANTVAGTITLGEALAIDTNLTILVPGPH